LTIDNGTALKSLNQDGQNFSPITYYLLPVTKNIGSRLDNLVF